MPKRLKFHGYNLYIIISRFTHNPVVGNATNVKGKMHVEGIDGKCMYKMSGRE